MSIMEVDTLAHDLSTNLTHSKRSFGNDITHTKLNTKKKSRDIQKPASKSFRRTVTQTIDIPEDFQKTISYSCDRVFRKKSEIYSLEYRQDIMNHLFATEDCASSRPLPDYMYTVQQSDKLRKSDRINHKMRTVLLNWLADVHHKFKLRQETMFLATNILDRFLSKVPTKRDDLQLLGCTCMWVASKYHDIYAPSMRDFAYISDRAFTAKQMIKVEKQMIEVLGFGLAKPTPLAFLQGFNVVYQGANQDEYLRIRHLSNYLCERCLLDYRMLKFKPSVIAAACMYTAIALTAGAVWCHEMQGVTRHSVTDTEMREAVAAVKYYVTAQDEKLDCKHGSVINKYSKSAFGSVAKLRPVRPRRAH